MRSALPLLGGLAGLALLGAGLVQAVGVPTGAASAPPDERAASGPAPAAPTPGAIDRVARVAQRGAPPPAAPVGPSRPAPSGEAARVAAWRADPSLADRLERGDAGGAAPLSEEAAVLRAGYAEERARTHEAIRRLLADPATDDEVRDYAVRFLAERAPEDAAARETLQRTVWPADAAAARNTGLRRRAAAALASSLPADELAGLRDLVALEHDGALLDTVHAGLLANPHASESPALRALAEDLGARRGEESTVRVTD